MSVPIFVDLQLKHEDCLIRIGIHLKVLTAFEPALVEKSSEIMYKTSFLFTESMERH